jgi:hypothetical protein
MNRRTILLSSVPLLVALAGCSRGSASSSQGAAPSHSAADLRSLTVDEVSARIAARDGATFVYDDNAKDRYARGHLPGAIWMTSSGVKAESMPPNKDATLIFYCANES